MQACMAGCAGPVCGLVGTAQACFRQCMGRLEAPACRAAYGLNAQIFDLTVHA